METTKQVLFEIKRSRLYDKAWLKRTGSRFYTTASITNSERLKSLKIDKVLPILDVDSYTNQELFVFLYRVKKLDFLLKRKILFKKIDAVIKSRDSEIHEIEAINRWAQFYGVKRSWFEQIKNFFWVLVKNFENDKTKNV